jgi:hypothetical protein
MSESEHYWLHTVQGRVPLPRTLRPGQHLPTGRTPNLVRARGYREVYDLSDGLPDPAPLTLSGVLECESEDALSLALAELRRQLRATFAFDRDGRRVMPVLGVSLISTPTESDDSSKASLTITLIPASVPDPDDSNAFDW